MQNQQGKTEKTMSQFGPGSDTGPVLDSRTGIIARLRSVLYLSLALLTGLYLAILPFGMYAFAQHNPRCLCHGPYQLIQMRWDSMFGR